MAWSRRRKWFVLIPTVLVLVLFVAAWLQPVSPMRNAYDDIRIGMNGEEVAEVLDRRLFLGAGADIGANIGGSSRTLTFGGAGREALTIRWDWPHDGAEALVVGKEYHSAFEAKLLALWEQLRRMLP
jgi:hypothetical protein